MGPDIVVANLNMHAGIDGWGRTFDVLAACQSFDADVLVLEEVWTPEGGESLAARVASALGYHLVERVLGTGRRARPDPGANKNWKRAFDWRGQAHALYLDGAIPFKARITESARYKDAEAGSLGIAVLTRLPIVSSSVIDLGRLRRDRLTRAALVVRINVDGHPMAVVGTHMSHLTYGSITHFRQLRRQLAGDLEGEAAVLVGDMNVWGPPVELLFLGWHRAVLGRSWPAWRPHSQVDHILMRGPIEPVHGEALPDVGSDHRPVRGTLRLVDPG